MVLTLKKFCRRRALLLSFVTTLLAAPAQAGPQWLKCTFNEATPSQSTNPVSSYVKSQQSKNNVEFVNSSGQRFTLNATYSPTTIVFTYPKVVSSDVSYDIEFRIDRKSLAIGKQVSNELSATQGTCAFSPAP
jgi:hypothetical protein